MAISVTMLIIASMMTEAALGNKLLPADVAQACMYDCKCTVEVDGVNVECNSFTKIPPQIPNNTTELRMNDNDLRHLTNESFQYTISNYSHLLRLHLSNTSLSAIESDTFKRLPQLRELHLDENYLTTDTVLKLQLNKNIRISLINNLMVDCDKIRRKFTNAICYIPQEVETRNPTHTAKTATPPRSPVTPSPTQTSGTWNHTDFDTTTESNSPRQASTGPDYIFLWVVGGVIIGVAFTAVVVFILCKKCSRQSAPVKLPATDEQAIQIEKELTLKAEGDALLN